ncbi:Golgi membrane exchange factor (Ric1p-Rgp1p) subunit [Saxophila tyrrhenica]|uniref:Golgi membrane exchange factor (Ric1p-Rgp1p) subunit n=1 Tax=Saxophila tyrrhenica TaxID=1690608 RepID=A0AAV9PQX0_9PEZI|nr:Golgi membrane exchange factor (Ric1p-Rgp1p) subunit [Saxophila tyrrhenica]
MPPAPAPSNIRAHVQWREPSVYAGEEIECIITFKNIAVPPNQEQNGAEQTPLASSHPPERRPFQTPSVPHSRKSSAAQGKAPSRRTPSMASNTTSAQPAKGHRPTLSLNVVNGQTRGGLQSAPIPAKGPNSAIRPTAGHGRSLSIMSYGSDVPNESRGPSSAPLAKRPLKGHGRSASLQLSPKPQAHPAAISGSISPRQPSPLYESNTPPALAEAQNDPLPVRPARRRPGTVSMENTPQLSRNHSLRKSPASDALDSGFQFPGPQQPPVKSPSPQPERPRRSPSNMHSGQHRAVSPRPPDGWTGALSNLNPITRVMSETSTAGTPRSSSEFYSLSNHSDETLTSEVPTQAQRNGRLLPRPSQSRQASMARVATQQRSAKPETLMMGYAQTMGFFVLDGSLVNAAPFEEVKRKGVQGGGGVVGVEKAKRSSGMFGAFSWGNIGESLGGLLGGDDMSSMAQMKASAGSKSIPLLSTPQNLLFVDLRLAPGESRSYNYRFTLPRGLPPSYRGRAIKVFYHLALGIQRPEGQAVKHVDIPFRVLGSYNSRGETLGHDLMSPYILLQDAARSRSMTPNSTTPSGLPKFEAKPTYNRVKPPKQGLEDFLRYTERLLETQQDAHGALVSPTSPITPSLSRTESVTEQQPSRIKDAVDFAITRANHVNNKSKQQGGDGASANRFNIARGGHPVAVLTLLRPAYRLGETVMGTIDFTAPLPEAQLPSPTPSYSVLAELESAERVDPSLAIRSGTSINRVTRKVHASLRNNVLYARQISFSLTIPSTATPTFETTGVSLVWKLRVEFTTERQVQGLGLEGSAGDEGEDLLEEIASDERGRTLIAREKLMAETFEIEVPLKVFGVVDVDAMSVTSEAWVI